LIGFAAGRRLAERRGILASAKATTAWPTIAFGQALRAEATVWACSLSEVQTSRPLVWTAPCLSNSKVSVCRIGGSSPAEVAIEPEPRIVIGALVFFGSASGAPPAPTPGRET
jgi:hypothetical protein